MKVSIIGILNLINKENIDNIYFVDSYGGLKSFFELFDQNNKTKNFLIICSNFEIYKFLASSSFFRKKIFYYQINKKSYLLKSFLSYFYLLPLKIISKKVDKIYCYKLIVDNLRYSLINIISTKNTKIIISDQFYKSYKFNKIKFSYGKKIIINIINFFSLIKLKLYLHQEFDYGIYPCLDKKFNIKTQNHIWKFFLKKYFKKKINIKKNSLLIIDETINLLIEYKWINSKNLYNKFKIKLNSFLKKNKIESVYYKKHPTSKIGSYLIEKLKKEKKIIYLEKKYPLEFYLDEFKYCIFSASSSLFLKTELNLFSINKLLEFKKKKL